MSYGKYCPDPQFERKDYEFLCGTWEFGFGEEGPLDRTIVVPYSYESRASGIGDERVCTCVRYRRTFRVKPHEGRLLLHFEAVDYETEVRLNGKDVGSHRGGFTHFCLDITDTAHVGENVLEVRVHDSLDKSQLRGKQRAREKSYDCWYVQTTGIWKPVWIEYAGDVLIEDIHFTTENGGAAVASVRLSASAPVKGSVYDETGALVAEFEGWGRETECPFTVPHPLLWSAGSPHLYHAVVRAGEKNCDEVGTYFAFREIVLRPDGIYVNGTKEFQQMVLDQGYWSETGLTPPDEEAIERDVRLIKEMGFNGVRKHQKVESSLFYHLCDKYGLYVWGEIPSPYAFDGRMREEYLRDSADIVRQLRSHPSVICWLLFNEAWGVSSIEEDREEQAFVEEAADAVRALDGRPVITNDGWHHLDSDILSLHEYEQNDAAIAREYTSKDYVVTEKVINTNKFGRAFADGYSYCGQPIIISEYGGVAIEGEGWGYGESAPDASAYESRVRRIVKAVRSLDYISGCCYTQLTDVQQEINGLLTENRVPKLPIRTIRDIFAGQ